MKKILRIVFATGIPLAVSYCVQAQVLDVSVANAGNNTIRITGTPTSPGFSTGSTDAWTSMNLTWRIPKTATDPSPTVVAGAATPEVTGESTEFTGANPEDAFTGTSDLSMFDLTAFGQPDDGYWYFQVTGTSDGVQDIATGDTVVLYEFALPTAWSCPGCVEIMTSDIPGLPISTTSYIDNASMGVNVMNVTVNDAPLPLNFTGFDARRRTSDIALNWQVENEDNMSGYYVERSGDGMSWATIGYVDARPRQGSHSYSFLDPSPLSDVNYYRIRGVNQDGRKIYSVIRKVSMKEPDFMLKIYPVPVHDALIVKLQAGTDQVAHIRVTDVQGRVVLRHDLLVRAGDNEETLAVGNLRNGTYFIEITGRERKWTAKFVKE